jgi:hypothetical protein
MNWVPGGISLSQNIVAFMKLVKIWSLESTGGVNSSIVRFTPASFCVCVCVCVSVCVCIWVYVSVCRECVCMWVSEYVYVCTRKCHLVCIWLISAFVFLENVRIHASFPLPYRSWVLCWWRQSDSLASLSGRQSRTGAISHLGRWAGHSWSSQSQRIQQALRNEQITQNSTICQYATIFQLFFVLDTLHNILSEYACKHNNIILRTDLDKNYNICSSHESVQHSDNQLWPGTCSRKSIYHIFTLCQYMCPHPINVSMSINTWSVDEQIARNAKFTQYSDCRKFHRVNIANRWSRQGLSMGL